MMQMHRFTRLVNAFSRKLQHHQHALALFFMHYNYVRAHQTLKTTPAHQAGVMDRWWTLEEIVERVKNSN